MEDSEKINDIREAVYEIREKVIAQEIYQKQHRKEIDAVTIKADKLEAERNVFAGILLVLSAIFSGIIAYITKH